jgi:hypothetical protein
MSPQKRQMTLRLLLPLLFGAGPFIGIQGQNSHKDTAPTKDAVPTLTVCEALTHPLEYDGKMVRIRGHVVSTSESAGFLGEDCPGIYVTDGKVWPSAIAWTMPRAHSEFILHPIDFEYERASDKPVEKKYRHLRKRMPDRCIDLTYTGLFEIWTKAKARKPYRDGWVEIPGFGHQAWAPAQLVLKSADDATPIPNCNGKK